MTQSKHSQSAFGIDVLIDQSRRNLAPPTDLQNANDKSIPEDEMVRLNTNATISDLRENGRKKLSDWWGENLNKWRDEFLKDRI